MWFLCIFRFLYEARGIYRRSFKGRPCSTFLERALGCEAEVKTATLVRQMISSVKVSLTVCYPRLL
jgi:hypothetical protein